MKKKKRRRKAMPNSHRVGRTNAHHLLWQRREWNEDELSRLRSHPYCIVEIPAITLHREIHEQIWRIPPPSPENARAAFWHLQYLDKYGGIKNNDPIEKRLNVLISLFDFVEQPTADALREQLSVVCEFNKKAPE